MIAINVLQNIEDKMKNMAELLAIIPQLPMNAILLESTMILTCEKDVTVMGRRILKTEFSFFKIFVSLKKLV